MTSIFWHKTARLPVPQDGTNFPPRPLLKHRLCCLAFLLGTIALWVFLSGTAQGASYQSTWNECTELFRTGKYDECIQKLDAEITDGIYGEKWHVLKVECELLRGKYTAASETISAAQKRYSWSIQLRWLTVKTNRFLAAPKQNAPKQNENEEKQILTDILKSAEDAPWRYTDADDLICLGNVALALRVDARDVLEKYFDRAKARNAEELLPYLASGTLALEKHDAELAGQIFQQAAKKFPNEPDVQYGLATAFSRSNPELSAKSLSAALKENSHHLPSLLMQVEDQVDSEQYSSAKATLESILAINPHHPEAWAYRAILAHLENKPKEEQLARNKALAHWKTNPVVDHLIGKKLSQKYRFTEGAAAQKRALEFDPHFAAAKIQLSQDLLRLGKEREGWEMAKAAQKTDEYDVVTFNLLELHDNISKFQTLEDEHFILRMEKREAAIYGQRVLSLLNRSKQKLCAKYGLELTDKITVEIFPDANDFAVRTFGMPAVSGYLGVCFGKVITANSPASQQEHPSNWEAVLWHEFCHVVTLHLTNNKMPRWLSEGISVYEELQENPTWGQRMNVRYREMILNGELTPVGELSSAFMNPKTPFHIQFAYYESCLVVEYLVEHYGLETLTKILRDLGAGLPINVALDRHTDGLKKLESEFEKFATERAKNLAPKADWTRPDLAALLHDDTSALAKWLETHPTNFIGLSARAQQLIEDRQFEAAKIPLKKMIGLYPDDTSTDNASLLLAQVHHELKETAEERRVLAKYATLDDDALQPLLRLLELEEGVGNWAGVVETGEKILAINPLIAHPYRVIAEGAEKVNKHQDAVAAWQTVLLMDADDPAEAHYRLARLLHHQKQPAAKRHVLLALEEAPRFRAAHRLLLEIRKQQQ